MADDKDQKPASPASPEAQAPKAPEASAPQTTATPGGPAPAAAPPAPAPPAAATPVAAAPPKPAPPPAKPDPLKAPVPSPAVDRLREAFLDQVIDVSYYCGEPLVTLRKEKLETVLRFLRDDPGLQFDYLSNVTGVHWPQKPKPFEIVYHLFSIPKRHRVTLKLQIAEGEEAPTASRVWPTANWHEREIFDLFGIRFSGHPDMTRILMTDEWVGHPLRKDYPLAGKPEDHVQYREVTTASHVYEYEKASIRGFGWKKEVEKTGEGNG